MPEPKGFKAAFRDLVKGLETWGQPFLLLGGWAVAAQGHIRATRDIDLTHVDRTLAEFCEVLEDESRLIAWNAIKKKLGRTGT